MKKYVYIGIIAQLILTVFIFLSVINQLELNKLLYKDKEKITILVESNSMLREPQQQADFIIETANNNQIEIFKYIFSSDSDLKIYTNQTMKNGFTTLGNPNESSTDTLKSRKDFVWTNSKIDLELKKFADIPETGISGVYYIQGNTQKQIHAFLRDINKLGTIQTDNNDSYNLNVRKEFFDKYLLILVWFLLLVVNLAILIQFLIKQTKKITLFKLFGWSIQDTLSSFTIPIIRVLLLSLSTVSLIIVPYFFIHYKGMPFIISFFSLSLLTTLLLITLYSICIYLSIKLIYRSNHPNNLKGNNYSSFGIAFNLFCKLAVATTIIILGTSLLKEQQVLVQHQNQNVYWEKTKNIYATQLRFITNDPDEYRPYEKNLKNFFNEATNKKGLFLINSSNYEKLSNGKPLYEMNTHSDIEQLTSPAGKSIIINKNYFAHSPIIDTQGKSPIDKIIYSPNHLNLLVPDFLNKFEKEIESQYLEYFSFLRRATSASSEPINAKINIIYVKSHQKYFTYNPHIDKRDFTIVDPISIVDTGNLDASFYAAWLTTSSFVQTEKKDGFNYLLPTIIKTNTLPSIQNTISIYNFRAEELNTKKALIYTIRILLICLTVIQIFNVFSSYQLIVEKYRYSLHIKRLFGYSFIKLFTPIVMPIILLDIILVSVLFILYRNQYIIFIITCWSILELLITLLTMYYLSTSINKPSIEKKGV
ncbi:ABC transporter permease [Enterococcus sp. DIV1283b]|uniref:ABC transporter permease n=1 Tax=Enterococcus sp. DIV1283b TaxID=2774745 RepID=UPI003F252494